MEIVPSISIQRERAVIAEGGEYRVLTDPDGKPADPLDIVDKLAEEHKRLLIIDIDGIATGEPQLELIQELPSRLEVWLDAGVKTYDDIYDIFMSGANRVVVGSKCLAGIEQLDKMFEDSDGIILGLDFSDGALVGNQGVTLDSLMEKAVSQSVQGILVEVLSGRLAQGTMERVKGAGKDLFVTADKASAPEFEQVATGVVLSIRDVVEGLSWKS